MYKRKGREKTHAQKELNQEMWLGICTENKVEVCIIDTISHCQSENALYSSKTN